VRRYGDFLARIQSAVLDSPAHTTPELRRAVAFGPGTQVPDALRSYVQKVALHAYRISDDDVVALQRAGYTEDQIFELTAAAALGAAVRRVDRGLAVLEESHHLEASKKAR
jgi:alkylhydroperoxidase family enzyme